VRYGYFLHAIFGIAIFYFIFQKANYASFTHDESFSYLQYVPQSFMELISFKDWYTNNHILNSIGMKYSEKLFGTSELSLRLHSLIALILYLIVASFVFGKRFGLLNFLFFLLLISNPAIIDLFGMARGYGLSYAFMLTAFFFLIKVIKAKSIHSIYPFHFAALPAVLSNFTMLTFYLASVGTVLVMEFLNQYMNSGKINSVFGSLKSHSIPLLFNIIVLYEPIRRVVTYTKLDFGGKTGFFADTISQLIINSLHTTELSESTLGLLHVIFSATVIVSSCLIIWNLRYKNGRLLQENGGLVVSNMVLILISLIIISSHLLLGADYPIGRFSLFLYPLFIVHLGFLMKYLYSNYSKIAVQISCLIIVIAAQLSFWQKLNDKVFGEWGYDSNTKDAMLTIQEYSSNFSSNEKLKLGVNWQFEPTLNFYRNILNLDNIETIDRDGIDSNDHFYYILESEMPLLRGIKVEKLKSYKDSKTVLLKRI